MAEVVVVFKVMPSDVDVDLAVLEKSIKDSINPEKIEREPIAFGLIALKVKKVVPDSAGVLEDVENKLKSVEGVGEVEVVEMSRML